MWVTKIDSQEIIMDKGKDLDYATRKGISVAL
jgi:hypothetical protein